MGVWKNVLVKHLGKKVLYKVESVRADILAVDVGIKAAYLYDAGLPDSERLVNVLQELRLKELIRNNLQVVEIGMDCLIVNVEELRNTVDSQTLGDRLVDVSKTLDKPYLCNDQIVVGNLKEAVKQIINDLELHKVTISVISSSICNVTSLFGILLNYPLVYWYSNHGNTGENCLSMEPLKCVKVTVKQDPKCTNKAKAKQGSINDHCLYSFSYPVCLELHCRPLVNQWYEKLKELVQKQDLFSSINISFEDVSLPAVSL